MDDVRLLIVDSEQSIRAIIRKSIEAEGYFADEAADGISALKLFRRNEYDLVVIDTEIPELDCYNVCCQIRKVSDVPIIVLSPHGQEEDKLSLFSSGIDDFVVKPFYTAELLSRIKVFLRRTSQLKKIPTRIISIKGIHIDTISRMVYINERQVQLTPKEYELLVFLSSNPNKAFSREVLLNEVWGYDFFGSDRTIDTHIKTLRDNLKPYHQCIVTIWGFGYKFEV